jgi:peptidoglycan/LPS O-acetylase OafA/YrhL
MNDRPINRGSVVAGVFFILVGAAFLLQELDVWDLKAVYVLPVLLIALGGAVLRGGTSRREGSS